MKIYLPTEEDVYYLHGLVLKYFGGREGVLRKHGVETSLASPKHFVSYEDCNLHKIAAVLLQSIARGHSFTDGNKRTAVLTCIYTYGINGVSLKNDGQLNIDVEKLVEDVVTRKLSVEEITAKLQEIVDSYTQGALGAALEKVVGFLTSPS